MERAKVGEVVKFVTPNREILDALVTAVWSDTCVNVVYVSTDEKEQDSCGRQTKHSTSMVHQSVQTAPGNFWAKHDEVIVFPEAKVQS